MPRNKTGGNRAKKGKNKRPPPKFILKSDVPESSYASIISNLGNGRCNLKVIGQNGEVEQIQGIIRGFTRRQKFFRDDIVLVGPRDYQMIDDRNVVDIIYKYNADHVQELIYRREIEKLDRNAGSDIIFSKRDNDENNEDKGNENDEVDNEIDNEDNGDEEDDEEDEDDDGYGNLNRIKLTKSEQKRINGISTSGKKTKAIKQSEQNIKLQDNFNIDDL